jgi:uncharacterized protein (TIGR03435 family)
VAHNLLQGSRKILYSRSFATSVIPFFFAPAFLLVLTAVPRSRAQQPKSHAAPPPSFEVASIKVHTPDPSGRMFISTGGGDASRYAATNVTAKMLITFAYDLKNFQVLGGPNWIDSNRYDVDAKVQDDLVDEIRKLPRLQQIDRMRPMVRALLADRFKMSVTEGTKELPVFALVAAKGGAKLTESAPPPPRDPSAPPPRLAPPGPDGPPPPAPGGFYMFMNAKREAIVAGNSVPLSNLVNMLSQQLGREIIDQTGLKGTYTFKLSWTSEQGLGGGPLPLGMDNATADTGEPIFTAIQEQLGLKLEDTKAPVETITVDHIEEPSAN